MSNATLLQNREEVARQGDTKPNRSPTIFELQEVLYQVLHQAVLLCHVPLEVDHLGEHGLVVALEVAHVRDELLLVAGHLVEAGLEGLHGGARGGGRGGVGCGFAGGGDLALDVFEGVSAIDVEIGMAEGPALQANASARAP